MVIGGTMIALTALAACGLDHGTITDLTYEPDASFWMPYTTCDTKGSCTTTLQYYYIPECWHVWFADSDQKGDDCVSHRDYDSLTIGAYFDERR